MRESDIPEILKLDLFRNMESTNFDRLMRGAYVQMFPPQVDLTQEGDRADFLHVLMSGSVELYASWNGNDSTMAIVRPVSTFILAATVRDAPYLMNSRTMEKSRIIMLPSGDVRDVFDKDAGFARAVVTELAQCYRSVVKSSKNLKLRSSIERLANYMLRKSVEYGCDEFRLPLEKRALASYLGMTPENLSRSIKALRPYGVEVNGYIVTLTNIEDLTGLAKPTLGIDDQCF